MFIEVNDRTYYDLACVGFTWSYLTEHCAALSGLFATGANVLLTLLLAGPYIHLVNATAKTLRYAAYCSLAPFVADRLIPH